MRVGVGSPEQVDFSGAWDELWARIAPELSPELLRLGTWVGVLMIVFSAVKWLYSRSSGRGQSTDNLLYVLVFGALLASPEAILPLIARVADAIINPILRALS